MKRHPSVITREQRAMNRSRGVLNRAARHVVPLVPTDAKPTADAVRRHPQWSDDLPLLTTRRHATWFHVTRMVQHGDNTADWGWEFIAEAIGMTDAIVVATTQKWRCCVHYLGRCVFDNRKDIKII
jgi:hypothetical protein